MKLLYICTVLPLLLLACSPSDPPEYPRDISKTYDVRPTRDISQKYHLHPPPQPERVGVQTISLPCQMVVLNNDIQLLTKPYSGADRLTTQFKAGTIVIADKSAGEWLFVKHGFSSGWIHKDNLQPAS